MTRQLPTSLTGGCPLLREIVLWPDQRLRQVCEPIMPEEFNGEELYSQAGQMMLSLWKHRAIGIAANQLGYENQMIVVVPHPEKLADKHGYPIIMCNPQIIVSGSMKQLMKEGCLSFPGVGALRRRSARINIYYQTIDGAAVTRGASGLLAQCIQHEVDHLNGIVFTDPDSGPAATRSPDVADPTEEPPTPRRAA